MAFFRRFGQSKTELKDTKPAPAEAVGPPADSTGSPQAGSPTGTGSPSPRVAARSRHGRDAVLKGFHVTEKSTRVAAHRQYVFLVEKDANKSEVKRTVESRFGVSVEGVTIVNLPAKVRRRGAQIGWKSGRKKAIVTVKEGQRIEVQ